MAVTGECQASEAGGSHSRGFEIALERAVRDAGRLGKGQGPFSVRVEFTATVRVTNPGQIQKYEVTIS